MKAVCERIGVARSNVAERAAGRSPKRRGRPPLPDGVLLERIEPAIADMPSYGYARVWAVLRRDAIAEGPARDDRGLTDDGSCYVAGETRRFTRDIGLEPLPVESPQSNGVAWLSCVR